MIEQIRLWFYSMLFMSVTLEECAPYKKVISYGSVVRENGEKFSKSAGKDKNIVLDNAISEMGADTIRYLYAGTTSVNDLRFGYSLGDDAKRRILAFWNTYSFFDLYSNIDNPEIDGYVPTKNVLEASDKWAIQLLHDFIDIAQDNYEKQLYLPILKAFEQFIDDINNWYIRINRRRFWKEENDSKQVAYWTLYTIIKNCTQIMAPIIPFITDFIWHDMVKKFEPNEALSVHLSNFPIATFFDNYSDMIKQTAKVREIISHVQKMRNEKKIMIKQPLQKLCILGDDDYISAVSLFQKEIKDELNIKEILFVNNEKEFVDISITVNFAKAGAVLKQNVNKLKDYLLNMTTNQKEHLMIELMNHNHVKLDKFDVPLSNELFIQEMIPKAEYAMTTTNDIKLFLYTNISKELRDEFILRTLIRKIQVLRKDKGYKIESHISIQLSCENESMKEIIVSKLDVLMSELLADSFEMSSSKKLDGVFYDVISIEDISFQLYMQEILS